MSHETFSVMPCDLRAKDIIQSEQQGDNTENHQSRTTEKDDIVTSGCKGTLLGSSGPSCYGSTGRSDCNEVSRVEVATMLGWTSQPKSSSADLEGSKSIHLSSRQ